MATWLATLARPPELAATDDGSLFIGTAGLGPWNGTPAMLYVLTDTGLTVLRGY